MLIIFNLSSYIIIYMTNGYFWRDPWWHTHDISHRRLIRAFLKQLFILSIFEFIDNFIGQRVKRKCHCCYLPKARWLKPVIHRRELWYESYSPRTRTGLTNEITCIGPSYLFLILSWESFTQSHHQLHPTASVCLKEALFSCRVFLRSFFPCLATLPLHLAVVILHR